MKFIEEGTQELELDARDASKMSQFDVSPGMELVLPGSVAFSNTNTRKMPDFTYLRRKPNLGKEYLGATGDRCSSMWRNIAKRVWQFGVSASAFWPFPHFSSKSRVLFAPLKGEEAGDPIDDVKETAPPAPIRLQGLAQQTMAWPDYGVS